MRKVLLISSFIMVYISSLAQVEGRKEFSPGISSGYTNDGMIAHEIFVQLGFKPSKIQKKARFGLIYRPFNAQFRETTELKTEGTGLFAEIDIYPFQKYFFAGVRWDVITLNWLTSDALNKINTLELSRSFVGFTGTNIYGITGFAIPVDRRFNILLYGMYGAQHYKISDGELSFGSYIIDGSIPESHTRFAYQFNIAVTIRIR